MPGPDDHLRSALERLAPPADPAGAYERIVEKKIRRQIYRKFQATALAIVVLAGTVGGTVGLLKVFGARRQHVAGVSALADNGLIAFVSARDGSPDIFVMRRDGTHVVNLTHDPADEHSPAFSPDGTQIAFVSDRQNTRAGKTDIYVMDADGSGVHQLTHLPGYDDSPSWSPDGSKIAFADNSDIDGHQANYQLYVMDADGSDVTRLSSELALAHESRAAWSPDGRRIAFTGVQGQPYPCPTDADCPVAIQRVIFVTNTDGTGIRQLPTPTKQVSAPAWSPDGREIAFSAEGDIYIMSPTGSGLHRLTAGPLLDTQPSWSPDGRKLVFASDHTIGVVNVDGSGRTSLTSGVSNDAAPSWQPLPKGRPPVEPSESPAESSTASPEPSETPSPSSTPPSPPECATSFVSADFNGDGLLDTAAVCPGDKGDYTLEVVWGPGPFPAGAVALGDCQNTCEALAGADLDGDGAAELFLQMHQGASTEFVEVFELPSSENFGQSAVTVADPGAPGFPAGEPAIFADGGSVTHLDFLSCIQGSHEVIATSAKLDDKQTEWAVHETSFTLDADYHRLEGIPPDGYGMLTVVSTADSVVAFDPTGQSQPEPRGDPCWGQSASPSPSPTAVP